jgi:hypothetical protein
MMPYPGDIGNQRNAITQALMKIRNPPPVRQQGTPGGGIPNQGAMQRPMQPVMASAGPPPPQMPTGPAPGMQAFQQGQNLMAPPQGGMQAPRVPLGQVPGQMMTNLQQIPQRLQSLLPQQGPAPMPQDPNALPQG